MRLDRRDARAHSWDRERSRDRRDVGALGVDRGGARGGDRGEDFSGRCDVLLRIFLESQNLSSAFCVGSSFVSLLFSECALTGALQLLVDLAKTTTSMEGSPS